MNKQDTTLLQHWLKEVITSPGTLQHKLQKAQHQYALNEQDVVADHGYACIYTRLNVYTSGYVLRLLECLSADFPVLQKFVGDEVFNGFAKASLVWSPPVSYTLYDLGKNFIAFLEATRPVSTDEETDAMLDLPIELAKLERAKQEVLRAAGTEQYEATMAALNMEDILWQPHSLIISMPESTRLLNLKFPLKNFFEKISQDEDYTLPAFQHTYMAVSRKNYRVIINELTDWQYLFLLSCKEPISLSQAIEVTAHKNNLSSSQLMADLYLWLPIFCSNGLLTY